jgi:hypothetical protein
MCYAEPNPESTHSGQPQETQPDISGQGEEDDIEAEEVQCLYLVLNAKD